MSIEALCRALFSPPPAGTRQTSALDVTRVWYCIAEQADVNGRQQWPTWSGRTMALELGLPHRTVRAAIAALIAQGRLRKTADGIPRVSGDVFEVLYPARFDPVDSAELARGIPLDQRGDSPRLPLARGIPPTSAGDQRGGLARGIPAQSLPLSLETPPTPPCDGSDETATITGEDLDAIADPAIREMIARNVRRDADVALAAQYAADR